jgi:hypothetical protein
MSLDEEIIKALEDTQSDYGLRLSLSNILTNPRNELDTQRIIDITHYGIDEEDHSVVTLYLRKKYAQFYDEFTKIGCDIPELKQLINYLKANNWETNLD